jgi:solute carrier family 13 (sodium-dependent dicarboxylate transporter), member 2/3/5
MTATDDGAAAGAMLRRIGLAAGPLAAAAMLAVGAPAGFGSDAWVVAALTMLMAVWWVTEAVPISVTALLPVAVLPLLDVRPIADVTAPYAHPLIFLFLGGFLIALAIQRWNLHLRIALLILGIAGERPDRIVAGFMVGTALLSMWVSNTATAAMMLPIGVSVLIIVEGYRQGEPPESQRRFAAALLLGIAFGANIGGMGTLIGTPPNALFAAFMVETYGVSIGFGRWMLVGVPVALTLLAGAWWILTRAAFPLERTEIAGVRILIERKRAELGPLSGSERRVLLVFVATAAAWVLRPWFDTLVPALNLTDAGIAMAGAIALFLIPASKAPGALNAPGALLDWQATRELPWGVLLLVGGGLSLGTAIEQSGLALLVAGFLSALGALPVWLIVAGVALLTMLLSHVTSNTASAATLLPVASSLALALGEAPLLLAAPVALAASCAFMLPVATPPNAIVFGSDRITVADMLRAGSRVSVLALLLVVGAVMLLALPVFVR